MPEPAAIADLLEALAAEVRQLRARLDQPPQRFLTIEAAEAYSGLSSASLRRALSAGRLTPLRPVKGRVLIDKTQLDSWITNSTARPRTGRGLGRT